MKVHIVKAMVFPIVMYGCESWTIKQAKHQRIDAFELWCWRRLLRVPWTAKRSNQSILKEISSEYSVEGLMLKLKLQYLGHLMWKTDSLEKTLMLGKIEGRRRGQQRIRWLVGITDWCTCVWASCRSWWWTGKPGVLRFMGSQRVGHDWATELSLFDPLSILPQNAAKGQTKNWTLMLEKSLESPLDCKEIQPVHSEGDQPWDFFGRNDAKAETQVLWPPHAKSWLIGKDFDT